MLATRASRLAACHGLDQTTVASPLNFGESSSAIAAVPDPRDLLAEASCAEASRRDEGSPVGAADASAIRLVVIARG